MSPIIEWIYKYINRSQTCSVSGDKNGITYNDMSFGVSTTTVGMLQVDSEMNEGFTGLQMFGIVLTVLISILGALVLVAVLWKQKVIRI